MTSPHDADPQARIWELGLGFVNTAVMHALVESGVIEQLRDEAKTASELAGACGLNADALSRALRFASVIGVVRTEDDRHALTDVGRMLLKDLPGSLRAGLLLIGSSPWQSAWNRFDHYLAAGTNSFEPAMGAGFFEYLDRNPKYGEPFHRWQTILTSLAGGAIAQSYDFSPFRTVCDVGGGQGVLLQFVLNSHPHLEGVLYDQESALEHHVLGEMAGRVRIEAGSFFEHVPTADVLLLKNVLHDWSDERCRSILGQCRQAMTPTSRLLIVERVVQSPPSLAEAFYDLNMQVLMDGKERTEAEFRTLLHESGLELRRIVSTRSPMSILEVVS